MIAAVAPEFAGAATIVRRAVEPGKRLRRPTRSTRSSSSSPTMRSRSAVAKSEMGQGVLTSMAMIVAEELECDFAKVKVEYASAHRNLDRRQGLRADGDGRLLFGAPLARLPPAGGRVGAGAADRRGRGEMGRRARRLRRERAASCGMKPPGARRLTARSPREAARVALAPEPAIKTPDEFKLIGKSSGASTRRSRSTGAARFGIDTRLPGMVYAAVANCPVFGGKLKTYDFSADLRAPRDHRRRAGDEWRRGRRRQFLARQGSARRDADRMGRRSGRVDRQRCSFAPNIAPRSTARSPTAAAMATSARPSPQPAKVVEAVYEVPYLAHAPMEPLNATADWRPDRIDVWMGTQDPDAALQLRGRGRRRRSESVFVHNCFLGGGFGRRAVNDELTPGGRGLQGAGQAGQADLDARGGHAARPLSPAGRAADQSRARRSTARRPASIFAPRSGRSRARSDGARSERRRAPAPSKGWSTFPIAPAR